MCYSNDIALKELLHEIAKENQQAFRHLFHLFYPKLVEFSNSIIKNREASFELVDDIFVKIWQRRASITDIQNITVYLYQATKNSCINFLKKKHIEIASNPLEFADINLSDSFLPDTILINKELAAFLHQTVNNLSPKCKIVFKLVKEDNLTYKEVADIMNVSVKTVDSHLFTAVKTIREAIANYKPIHFFEKKTKKV